MIDPDMTEKRCAKEKSDEVVLDRQLIIEILKTLEGLKRVLHSFIKT